MCCLSTEHVHAIERWSTCTFRGVVPLLESLGVRLSSAKFIAPYVSAAGLPVLIDRVKFLKEMLFSSSGYETLIGRNAKRMMMHLSIPADEALQSTLSFF